MNAALHNLSRRKRIGGSVLINTAIAMSLIVITLLGTQLGYLFFIKRELQKTADLAALSGAQSLQPFLCTDAKAAAVTNAAQNMPWYSKYVLRSSTRGSAPWSFCVSP